MTPRGIQNPEGGVLQGGEGGNPKPSSRMAHPPPENPPDGFCYLLWWSSPLDRIICPHPPGFRPLRASQTLWGPVGGLFIRALLFGHLCTYLASCFATSLPCPIPLVVKCTVWFLRENELRWQTKGFTNYFAFFCVSGFFSGSDGL